MKDECWEYKQFIISYDLTRASEEITKYREVKMPFHTFPKYSDNSNNIVRYNLHLSCPLDRRLRYSLFFLPFWYTLFYEKDNDSYDY